LLRRAAPRFLIGRVKPDRVYALRVKGDSMIDEHIYGGDIALIENRTDARDGEIVVALLSDENQATLKRLYRRGANIEYNKQTLSLNRSLSPPATSACRASSAGFFDPVIKSARASRLNQCF
jgi:SOS-response transcriptional repressor LexA